ncbi:TRAP transporter small permease subunit [Hyphomonas johnsonii]|uniref:TRAP transporter small permease protein n=1 Tax=Hyphomonas johnsonii MHS-2 TaxID=1280950 RepID=A0A059FFT1_9PROT|nr:TRAP transporter small permease subunit [Hyphomonas johnsonii]KCZ89457.1 TRAP dicarboxylate transporter subunit DctQ [Hyphomonas johnsonii MHS-2]
MDPAIFLMIGAWLKILGLLCLPFFLVPLIALTIPGLVDGFAKRMIRALDAFTGGALNAAMASALILVVSQLVVVILRYAFGLSFTWLNEIVMYAFAGMFMLGSAAALRDDAHVRVDILRPRFGETGRNWIELVGTYLFLFPICLRLITTGEQGLTRSWGLLEGSRESDGLPILFLFKTLVPVFAVLMLGAGLSVALKAALRLTGALPPGETPIEGEAGDEDGI